MRNPEVYTATEIANWSVSEEAEPGIWRPARCCPFHGLRLLYRLRIAWRVFTGRYDALNWGKKSGEWPKDHIQYRDCTDPNFKLFGKEGGGNWEVPE